MNKKLILFAVFFLVLFVSVSSVNAYVDGGTYFNCSNCSDCTDAINDNTYDDIRLTADVTDYSGTCINNPANFSNKTFDCQGHTIDGDDSGTDYGIYLNGKTNNTIKDCVITDFSYGIIFQSSTDSSLLNMTSSSNTNTGILIYQNTNNTTIENVSTNSNQNNGIYLHTSLYTSVSNSISGSNSDYGFYVLSSNNSSFVNISANSNTDYGIYISSSKNNTLDNVTANSNSRGISLDSSYNTTLFNISANSNSYGIYLDSSNNTSIKNSTLTSNTQGIYLSSSSDTILKNNSLTSNTDYGLYLDSSPSNILVNNVITGSTYNLRISGSSISDYVQDISTSNTVDSKPIYYWNSTQDSEINATHNAGFVGLISCNNITVENLNLTKNYDGLLLVNTSNSTVSNNIGNFTTNAFYLKLYSNKNNIYNNTVNNNTHGVYLSSSSNNTLENNTIVGNTRGFRLTSSLKNNITLNVLFSNNLGVVLDSGSNSTIIKNNNLTYQINNAIDISSSYLNNISNNSATFNGVGVGLSASHNNTISNNTLTSNNHGVYSVGGSSNNSLINNTASLNTNYGIYFSAGSFNTINDSTFSTNVYSIYLYSTAVNNTIGNNIIRSSTRGIFLDSSASNNSVLNNSLISNSKGLYLDSAPTNILEDNTMSNNSYNFVIKGSSISDYVQDISTSNTVDSKPIYYWNSTQDSEINATHNAGFVGLISCNNITVENLNLTKNYDGLLLVNTSNSIIQNNNISSNIIGIRLTESSNINSIQNNSVETNVNYGIYLDSSSNNSCENNTVNSNSQLAFNVDSSSDNNFTNNTLRWNAIDISETSSSGNLYNNNTIYFNKNTTFLKILTSEYGSVSSKHEFNFSSYLPNGTTTNLKEISSLSSSPNFTITYNNTTSAIFGNITPTKVGVYSLKFNLVDSNNNSIHHAQNLYSINNSANFSTTVKYYLRVFYALHGQPTGNGRDSKVFLFSKPTTKELLTCSAWVQASLDHLPIIMNGTIDNVSVSYWYRIDDLDPSPYDGLDQQAVYYSGVDVNNSISTAPSYLTFRKSDFANIGWNVNDSTNWYDFTFKLRGDYPVVLTGPDNLSYVTIDYITNAPSPMMTNPAGLTLISSTMDQSNLKEAEIILDGTGTKELELKMPEADDYVVYFDGSHCANSNCNYTTNNNYINVTATFGSEHNITIKSSPQAEATSPSNNSVINTSIYTFSYNITSINNISACSFLVNNSVYRTRTAIDENQTNYFHHNNLSNGTYNWQVNCTDINSNEATTSLYYFNVSINPNNLDGDNLSNDEDPLWGTNETVISDTIDNPGVVVDNTTNLNQNFTGTLEVNLTNDVNLVSFSWNFTADNPLKLFNTTFEDQGEGAASGGTLIHFDMPAENLSKGIIGKKTLYVKNISASNSVCIKDTKDITSLNEISSTCREANEVFLECNGTAKQGYNCTSDGDYYKITGLTYSAVKEQKYSPPPTVGEGTTGAARGARVRYLNFTKNPIQTIDIIKTDILLFDFKEERHSITVNDVHPKVELTIRSTPTALAISQINVPKYISLDETSIVDMSITLKNKSTHTAYLTLQLLERKEEPLLKPRDEETRVPEVDPGMAVAETLTTEVSSKLSLWFTLSVFGMLGLLTGFSIYHFHENKKSYSFGSRGIADFTKQWTIGMSSLVLIYLLGSRLILSLGTAGLISILALFIAVPSWFALKVFYRIKM